MTGESKNDILRRCYQGRKFCLKLGRTALGRTALGRMALGRTALGRKFPGRGRFGTLLSHPALLLATGNRGLSLLQRASCLLLDASYWMPLTAEVTADAGLGHLGSESYCGAPGVKSTRAARLGYERNL